VVNDVSPMPDETKPGSESGQRGDCDIDKSTPSVARGEPPAGLVATASVGKRAFLITVVAFVSYAYFYEGGGWNQNSRFDLVRAILDEHTLRIDAYHENTGDKAFYQGHYYSDKAPGLALLAVPAAAASRPVLRAVGVDPHSPRGLVATSYLASLFAVALPTALGCACLFLISLRLGSGEAAAGFAALAMGLATPIWPYATLFWAHALVGACLLFGFGAALMLGSSKSPRADWWWGLTVGLAAGWATVSEYPAAPASAILALLALCQVWRGGWPRRWPTAAGIAAGAGVCIVVLMAYQYAAFGSAFHLGYSYYEPGAFPWMQHGYLGLRFPRVDVAFKLLFGCRRGLFVVAPVGLAAVFGLRLLRRQKTTRAAVLASSSIAIYYWLFNSAFIAWPAGWSYGPRYMGAGIPLLCVGLAPAWDQARRAWRGVIAVSAACGGLFALMAVSVISQPPDRFSCALFQLLWPSFWAGKLSYTQKPMLTATESATVHYGAFNLGELMGMHGLMSLIPLILVWVAAGAIWMRMERTAKERTGA
jgi:hypothetical protein